MHLDWARRNTGDCSNWTGGQQGVDTRSVAVGYPWRGKPKRVPAVDEGWLDQNPEGREGRRDGLLRLFLSLEVPVEGEKLFGLCILADMV